MQKRSSIMGGLLMILIGVLFLTMEMFPELALRLNLAQQWPLVILALGGIFLLSALFGAPPMAVPGSVIIGIGGILYYQSVTGNWASWAYVWALIPGFAGVGLILSGLLERQGREMITVGGRMVVISSIMFVIFGALFSRPGWSGIIWPVMLMLAGAWLLIRGRKR
ncbi:MAG: hypothetical protein H6664_11135 [Ardenticatenaceae bacterium]|nr:hypothetical protein [Ardenticatenaceae bacterium]MCB9004916.1 hypothetical protein [Ardenticatenaceae bacterium]